MTRFLDGILGRRWDYRGIDRTDEIPGYGFDDERSVADSLLSVTTVLSFECKMYRTSSTSVGTYEGDVQILISTQT